MTLDMTHRTQHASPAGRRPHRSVVTQLMPFNECRFDDCIAFLAAKHDRALSTYEMMKLHVLIDVNHTLDKGKPVIGGAIWPFTNGPVSRSAKSRVSYWRKRYELSGQMPDGFVLIDDGDRLMVKPTRVPEEEEFSRSELTAMDRAWTDVMGLLATGGFGASQRFFHEDGFIGKAWSKARRRGTSLDWTEIIDEYDAAHGTDHSRIKTMMCV